MRPILLLDSTDHVVRDFDSYKQANHFKMMNNRPDWAIKPNNKRYNYYA